ncbi:hypothetical protein CRUP_033498, partial [Coryphaenoides rupestris]
FEGTREAEDLCRFWQNFLHPSVNKSSWTPDEIEHLKKLTYQRYVSKSLKRAGWTAGEDVLLRELVEKMRIGNFIPYTQMSYFMEGRDTGQLMYRWAHVLDPSLRKGHWSVEEDQNQIKQPKKKIKMEVVDIEEEEELSENEEEGEEQVVYMDSDDEAMKATIAEEKKREREEEEREQQKEEEEEEEEKEKEKESEEVKPREAKPEEQPHQETQSTNFRYHLVERPCFGPVYRDYPVRTTLVDASGHLLESLVCLRPRVLRRGDRLSPLAMLQ